MKKIKHGKNCFFSLLCMLILVITTFFTPLAGSGITEVKAAEDNTFSVELADTVESGEQYIILGYLGGDSPSNCALSTDSGKYDSQRLAVSIETNTDPKTTPNEQVTEITFEDETDAQKCLWTGETSTENVEGFYLKNNDKYLEKSEYAALYWADSSDNIKEWTLSDHTLKSGTYKISKAASDSYFNCSGTYDGILYHVISDDPTQTHYSISFETNGASDIEDQSVQEGRKVKKPTVTYENHMLLGWYTDSNFTEEYDFSQAVTSSFTLYAKWAETVSVNFESNGGSVVDSLSIEKGTAAEEPAAPTKENYTFLGWYSDKDLETAYDFTNQVTEDLTLYAKWEKQPFVTIGDGSSSTKDIPYGNYYKNSTAEMIYTADEIGGSGIINSIAFYVANASSYSTTSLRVYLGYTEAETFASNTDCLSSENLTEVYSGAMTLGTSVGWEQLIFDDPFEYDTSKGNLVIAITHTANSYNSTLSYRYSTISNAVLYRQNDTNSSYSNISDYSNFSKSSNRPNIKIEIVPDTATKYTVSFESNGGSEIESLQISEGKTLKKPANPIKEGFLFAGWYKDQELTQAWDFENDTVAKDTILYAKWGTAYTVSFDTDGGSTLENMTVAEGATLDEPITEKYGYRIAGWYTEEEFINQWDFENTVVNANLTLYVKWEEVPTKLYEVELVDTLEDGEEYFITGTEITGTEGDLGYALSCDATENSASCEPVRALKKNGKVYIADETAGLELENCKWEATASNSGYLLSNTCQDKELYINAAYSSGTGLKLTEDVPAYYWVQNQTTVNDLAAVQLKNSLTSSYYSYYLNLSGNTPTLNYSGKVRLYKFTDSTLTNYTVMFESNGGSDVDSQTVREGKRVKQPEMPEKEGYYLEGWFADEDLTQPWDFSANRVTDNITLYAKWEPAYVAYIEEAASLEDGENYLILNNSNCYAMSSVKNGSYNKMEKEDVAVNSAQDQIIFKNEESYNKCTWLAKEGDNEGYVTLYNNNSGATQVGAGYLWNYYSGLYNYQYNSSGMSKEWMLSSEYGLLPYASSASQYAVKFNASSSYMLFDAATTGSVGDDKVTVYKIKTYETAELPKTLSNLVYNGQIQEGVSGSKGCTLTGDTACDCGIHTATATLKEGYIWPDKSRDPKQITWFIGPAKLTATYESESVGCDKSPTYCIKVIGFVNNESEDTVEEYSAPTIPKPKELKVGEQYTLIPEGGSAKNYTFQYEEGTLTIKDHISGSTVVEDETEAGYERDASYDEVVYCAACGKELSRKTITKENTNLKYKAEEAIDDADLVIQKVYEEENTEKAYELVSGAMEKASVALNQAKIAKTAADSEENEKNKTEAQQMVSDALSKYEELANYADELQKKIHNQAVETVVKDAADDLARLSGNVDSEIYTDDSLREFENRYQEFIKLVGSNYSELEVAEITETKQKVIEAYENLVCKSAQTMKVRAKNIATNYATLRKGNQKYQVLNVTGNKGTLSYSKLPGSCSYLSVDASTGVIKVKKGIPAGEYTIKLGITSSSTGDYKEATINTSVTVVVKKAAQSIKIIGKYRTVKRAELKKSNVIVAAISVKGGYGKKSYKKVSGSKQLRIDSHSGKITVKKGTAKGTYKFKVKVTVNGNENYKSQSKKVMIKITVK
ncbi:InlB B-repeat-containing protein [Eubacterium oxidoreducens]|uniref:Listeria/Bacterioides repeat-containing protein n=1 Tax=Eubacterium oxidoreducens TaxID=1732 RepID=A0A1G6A018_EUBOX|nr:InlB B-repeat-containing protein [Eubacterium oxidoreducens]SDB01789.1 Listeria/Bacterioides repeat-containing protein [Eubacterium oxidoreducens]